MDWVAVRSDMLRAVAYDRESHLLDIEFTNGKLYRYYDVPEHEYESLIIAISKGKFFQQRIDGHFRFDRLR